MVTIYLNKQQHRVDAATSLEEVLVKNNCQAEHIAIALNNQLIPRSQFRDTRIKEGDKIDVIVPMQGG